MHGWTRNQARALPAITAVVLATLAASGCVERQIRVTSDPPGALVWLNDREVGRTPVETRFTFHGDYDVRVELDGYEPIQTELRAKAPVYEWPGIDLVATVLPVQFDNTIAWHFDLEPSLERSLPADAFEAELLARARELRAQTVGETDGPVLSGAEDDSAPLDE